LSKLTLKKINKKLTLNKAIFTTHGHTKITRALDISCCYK